MALTPEEINEIVTAVRPALLKALKADKEFKGPKGEGGLHGAQGDMGPAGPVGQKGDPGPVGPRGPQGGPGDRGPEGKEGRLGPVGQQGPQGVEGKKGADGQRGIPGPNGDSGPRGETGLPGPMGPRGRDGEPGAPGVAGSNYSCRATSKDNFTINPGEWTTMHFNSESWDSGEFHANVGPNEFLGIKVRGYYRVEATVLGANKIRIIHIDGNTGKETPVAERNGEFASTKWKAERFDKFRVDVYCNDTLGVQSTPSNPVFLIEKSDKTG